MLAVALEGLDNALQCGQVNFTNEEGENRFAIQFEQDGLLDDLEDLQQHPNHNIYSSALKIIDKYFSEDQEANPVLQVLNNNETPFGTAGSTPSGLFDL